MQSLSALPATSRNQLYQLVQEAPIGICVAAVPSLEILVANEQFERLAGSPGTPTYVGKPPTKQPAGHLTRRLLPIWRQVVESHEAFIKDEIRVAGPAGGVFEVTCVALKGDDGAPWAIMTMAVDVTERAHAESAMREDRRMAKEAFTRESHISARFQSALLPRGKVSIPGYTVAHSYRPALAAEADVGGDFYNFFAIDEQRLGLVIGDVGGKGLEAATIAARVQHSVIALALNGPCDPGAVVEGVRRVVVALEEPHQLVTLFFGVLSCETGELCYANAGHDPPLLRHAATGEIESLDPTGAAIVAILSDSCASARATLARGDTLFLYTDGLPESHRRQSHDLLGIDRVSARLQELHAEEPFVIIEGMYQAALRHSQGYLRDDIALVAIRRLRPGDTSSETAFVSPPGHQ